MNQGREMNQDREFETYLQGKSDLSRTYANLPQVELPSHLDAAILAEAHRAVGSRPGTKPARRWAVPLSLVATLFAVVMIGMQLPYMLKDAALSQAPQRKAAAEKGESAAKPATDGGMKVQTMAKARSEAATGEPAAMPAPGAPALQNAPRPAVIPQAPSVVVNRQSGGAPAAAPAPAAADVRLREAEDVDRGEALSKKEKAIAPAESSLSGTFEQRAPAAARLAAPLAARQESGPAPLKDEASAAGPEEWLARIRKLRQAGKLDEAKQELAAFKKRYPDYPVPEAFEVR